ncbi:TonB-dependent receptor domain-containing protein [Bacteroidota bacterium]
MRTKFTLLLLLIFLISNYAKSESITQTIKGRVTDIENKMPLPGANVIVLNSNPLIGAVSDEDGYFRIENVPVGRVSLQVSYLGYVPKELNNLNLSSGKEMVLEITLEEQVIQGEEIVFIYKSDKTKPVNNLTTISARTFSVEESDKYAGSLGDVSRMAANYAGVQGTDASTNDIVIRGNSPNGLLWRLEGVDIPNPNHWGQFGATGGPISMLNNNVLSNSDFITGAFPAEYGNALSGVFDLKMRNGNYDKHEYIFQMGLNGFELGAEGPISKVNKSSYLINYRYSMMALMMKIVDLGTGVSVPEYQDLTFKLNFPTKKYGRISVFGLGGLSDIEFLNSERDSTDIEDSYYESSDWESDMVSGTRTGIIGVNHTYILNESTYTKFSLAYTYTKSINGSDSLSTIDRTPIPYYRQNFIETNYFASFLLNKKFSSKSSIQTGISAKRINLNLIDSIYEGSKDDFDIIREHEGYTYLYQPYIHWQYKLSNALIFNLGLNYEYLALNNKSSYEPRAGLKWLFNENKSLSFAYGLHSQIPYILSYYEKVEQNDGTFITPNTDLDYTKAHHFVIGYDWNYSANSRLKVEAYYQSIFNVPVQADTASSLSMLNNGTFSGEIPEYLKNDGTGYNYGVELTLERFLNKGFYYLFTSSLYDSKYEGSDGVSRNTSFNGNYTMNVLAGKEWNVGKKEYRNIFSLNGKVVLAGGRRYTPVDIVQSSIDQTTVYMNDQAYSKQLDDFFRLDIRGSYKHNWNTVSIEVALDITNVTNKQNPLFKRYNVQTQEEVIIYQAGLSPMLTLRLLF